LSDRSRAAAARRAAILAAAGETFLTRGYDAATTLEIARLAKTSKRALYQHFSGKRDILNQLVLDRSREMLAPVDASAPGSRDEYFDALERFGVSFLSRLLDPSTVALYRLAIADTNPTSDLGQALWSSGHAPVKQGIRRFLEQGAALGHIVCADTDSALEAYFDLLTGWLLLGQLLRAEPPPDPTALRRRAAAAAGLLRFPAKGAGS
jgi:AcrR family transcriptional regulator